MDHIDKSDEVKVLEALKPHPNLKYLEIRGFRGFRLPDWINHSVLERVVSIKISNCKSCSCFPPFGEVPCLESLRLYWGSAEVKYVEEDDVHSGFPTIRRFPSLRKLSIWHFRNLKGLQRREGEGQFPMLEEMYISDCPMFVFPTLGISGKVEATGFRSISNLSALTSLQIKFNDKASSLPEEMFKGLANLKYLEINGCKNLKELPTSLASINALKLLEIKWCDALESLPEEGLEGLTSLRVICLVLRDAKVWIAAPKSLKVYGCPQVKKRCEKGIGEDSHKIAHIPNLHID